MEKSHLVIGTRGSRLAMIYAENVKNELKKFFPKEIKIKKIVTTGDQNQSERLSNIGLSFNMIFLDPIGRRHNANKKTITPRAPNS